MAFSWLQTRIAGNSAASASGLQAVVETALEADRDQIALWVPVALGLGIISWFLLPGPAAWGGALVLALGVAVAGALVGAATRLGRVMMVGALLVALGMGLIHAKAARVSAPVLARPVVTGFAADVLRAESLPARESVRLRLRPIGRSDLPPVVRLSLDAEDSTEFIIPGARIAVRARLMPPPGAALPGSYDYAQRAWFDGIGAVGVILERPVLVRAATGGPGLAAVRTRLSQHIQARAPGSAGGIAAALATGDQGAIAEDDADAMRASGLAHLLSISGLHVTALVGGVMFLLLRTLALSRRLALRWPLLPIAAAGGGLAGVAYTLLTGSEVPTVRSCIAALLVLVALSIGREALTLRLVAAGAVIVMLFWPESVVGPSFQLSFAAVTAIIALHQYAPVQRLLMRRDEGVMRRAARLVGGLVLTGLAVELALFPIALFHFHKAGVYGALANVVAIPLTTFVIMPLEALALALDMAGLGAPFWWLVKHACAALLWLAHMVAGAPGAVANFPVVPAWAFALTVIGGLWLLMWHGRWRRAGWPLVAAGLACLPFMSAPDLLITSDGRHVAARLPDGGYALLRDRAGDYVRDTLGEASGHDGEFSALRTMAGAKCSADFCVWEMAGQGADREASPRRWRVMASRSPYARDAVGLEAACAAVDIVISDSYLPATCEPTWLLADRDFLEARGGLSLTLSPPRITTSRRSGAAHPWRAPSLVSGNDEAGPPVVPAP